MLQINKLKMHVTTWRCFCNAFFVLTVKETSAPNLKHIYIYNWKSIVVRNILRLFVLRYA